MRGKEKMRPQLCQHRGQAMPPPSRLLPGEDWRSRYQTWIFSTWAGLRHWADGTLLGTLLFMFCYVAHTSSSEKTNVQSHCMWTWPSSKNINMKSLMIVVKIFSFHPHFPIEAFAAEQRNMYHSWLTSLVCC